jgi:hypothetical protein
MIHGPLGVLLGIATWAALLTGCQEERFQVLQRQAIDTAVTSAPIASLVVTDKPVTRLEAADGMRGMGVAATLTPTLWPADLSWKPLRNFGPFYAGSDFTEVTVHLDQRGAVFYYGDFLQSNADAPIYRQYYGTSLPTGDAPFHVAPGLAPTCFATSINANDVSLSLNRIRYAARYGGSIELLLGMDEDYEYEFCAAGVRVDVNDLDMLLYVVPWNTFMNPTSPFSATTNTVNGIEFRWRDVVTYSPSSPHFASDADETALEPVLDDIATHLATSTTTRQFRLDATRLAHAYLHTEFQDDLEDPNELVDMIEMSDDFADLHTHTGRPYFRVELKVDKINWDTEWTHEEIHIEVWTRRYYGSGPVFVVHSFSEIDDKEGTGWQVIALEDLNVCDNLQKIEFTFYPTESDAGLNLDDRSQTSEQTLEDFACEALESMHSAGNRGVVQTDQVQGLALTERWSDSDDVKGSLSYSTRISLVLR